MLWFLLALISLAALVWAIDVYRHRHPLDKTELFRLAQKRQRITAILAYQFSTIPSPADPAEKKAMKSQGEFVSCELDYHNTPARIAGLLKYKKHEWIVIVFIADKRVRWLWWNKGPDGTKVRSYLSTESLRSAIAALKPDSIAILHNHPNPLPSRYSMSLPSDADLQSARHFDDEVRRLGVNLLEFICERGYPYLYYAGFVETVVPIEPIVDEIQQVNGRGLFRNYALRKELKRLSPAEKIHGPDSRHVQSDFCPMDLPP